MQDGSQINVREHPVWLIPGPTNAPGACSGALVEDELVEQPGLSPENAAMRAAIFTAFSACCEKSVGTRMFFIVGVVRTSKVQNLSRFLLIDIRNWTDDWIVGFLGVI